MKKLASILLTLALIAALSVASFAATVTQPGSEGAELGVEFTEMTAAATVYSVDIVWDNNDFTFDYDAGEQGEWDAETHTYKNAVAGDWTDKDLKVTVTNHSNAAVKATLALSNIADGFTFDYEDEVQTLAAGVVNAFDQAAKVDYVITINGTPSAAVTKVATATISIAAAQ